MTGRTTIPAGGGNNPIVPQWSPVVMTGRTKLLAVAIGTLVAVPQWSPVVMTGRTGRRAGAAARVGRRRNGARS